MSTAIVWFRRDLRLTDNPALASAVREHDRVVPLYIHAPHEESPWSPGAASRWWLHQSLASLQERIRALGSRLILRTGNSYDVLQLMINETDADAVYWNRLYEPAAILRDSDIKRRLRAAGVTACSANAALLFEPWTVATRSGDPYRVFTPFWKGCRARLETPEVFEAPNRLPEFRGGIEGGNLAELDLLPVRPWSEGLASAWQPGEPGALDQVDVFMQEALDRYPSGRDFPDRQYTSRLSPHLHFGEVGPRQLMVAITAEMASGPAQEQAGEKFLRQVGWREFAHHILYHYPKTPEEPLDARFAKFPWRGDWQQLYGRWCRGTTGIPLVDAGLRELWSTGWMHNRVRMVVGSFLTKNLRVPWQQGARWFWDTLVDADLANNTLGWQWISGCGPDAAPYFRVFNPVKQAEKYDPDRKYIRRWVPELASLSDQHIASPWNAPAPVMKAAGVRLGETYPLPMVDLKESRQQALDAYQAIKAGDRT